jgi:hypothetical protein
LDRGDRPGNERSSQSVDKDVAREAILAKTDGVLKRRRGPKAHSHKGVLNDKGLLDRQGAVG